MLYSGVSFNNGIFVIILKILHDGIGTIREQNSLIHICYSFILYDDVILLIRKEYY